MPADTYSVFHVQMCFNQQTPRLMKPGGSMPADTYSVFHVQLCFNQHTPWLMKPGGSMPHSQEVSNNLYPEPKQSNSS
jgi:hypothetical protein